jgi:hypothetical protein
MIRIKIDLVPHGIESKSRPIGQMEIWNDATGDHRRGNYKFRFSRERGKERSGELKDFPRLSANVFELIRRCLNAHKES